MAKPKVKPLTFEEKRTLTGMGVELYEYLLNWKKDVYRHLQESGRLLPYLQERGEFLDNLVINCMQNGMDEAGAMEVARAEFNEDMMS